MILGFQGFHSHWVKIQFSPPLPQNKALFTSALEICSHLFPHQPMHTVAELDGRWSLLGAAGATDQAYCYKQMETEPNTYKFLYVYMYLWIISLPWPSTAAAALLYSMQSKTAAKLVLLTLAALPAPPTHIQLDTPLNRERGIDCSWLYSVIREKRECTWL